MAMEEGFLFHGGREVQTDIGQAEFEYHVAFVLQTFVLQSATTSGNISDLVHYARRPYYNLRS